MNNFFEQLYDSSGINLSIFYDSFDMELFIEGIQYTLFLSVVCIISSLIIGLAGAWAQNQGNRFFRALANGYVLIFRNTPPLIQLFFFYYAIGPTLSSVLDTGVPIFNNLTWAIISLSLYAGSFNVEIFRSGIEAISTSTIEAADTLGLSKAQVFRTITLPLSFRISLPALTNNLVNLIKTTTEAFAIAVPDILYASAQIWSEKFNVLEMMLILLTFFICIIGIFVLFMHKIEKWTRVPGWGH